MTRMRVGQRGFDVLTAMLALPILCPVFVLTAFIIAIEDGLPVFYCQQRIGRRGRPFRLFKFRSMVRNADRAGRLITVGGDPRITRIGAYLRRTKLDELPQIINVLRGEMSFVGPRPEVSRYVEKYDQEQRLVLRVSPGITDVASMYFRGESEQLAAFRDPEGVYIRLFVPAKIRLNMAYLRRATLASDVRTIFRTVFRR